MAQIRKFLFETDFDQPSGRRTRAGGDGEAPAKPPPPPPPTYHEEDLAAARREGHEAGFAEGRAAAEQETARRLAEAEERLVAGLAAVQEGQDRATALLTRKAIDVAVTALAKMLPTLQRRHGLDEIESVLRECVGRLAPDGRVTVAVHPDLAAPVGETAARLAQRAGFAGALQVVEDDEVAIGDCRVTWDGGGAERDSAALWRDIETIIQRHLEATAAVDATDGDTPAADAPAPDVTEEA